MPDFDLEAFLDDYQPRVEKARIAVPPGLVAEHERLDAELRDAMLRGDEPSSNDLARQLADVEARMDAGAQVFSFQAVTDLEWADLMADHPPTAEQLARFLDHNPNTFPPVAVAASSLEPKLTAGQATRLREKLSRPDWLTLWETVWRLNREVVSAPKSLLAGGFLPANNGSPGTAAQPVSPAPLSSDGNGAPSPATTTPKAP